jgi:lipopolysaccharide/colanic/teichoic acid biosynthesis glycosyltransferase
MNHDNQGGLPRAVEAAIASLALVTAAPLLALAAAGIALTSPGPILFRHQRAGRDGRPFALLKLRTMRTGGSGPQVTAGTDPRITAFGRFLRRTKIDELPQFWNVVRGELSLVGPRPEALAYVDASSAAWRTVLAVRPGITDPVTLQLRNEEALLSRAGSDPERYYREYLLPYKLRGYERYLAQRTWRDDVAVLWSTACAIVYPASVPSPDEIIASIHRAADNPSSR